MIIKSSQRAGHGELAAHLVKSRDIDGTPQTVTVSGSRGLATKDSVAGDLAANDNVHTALQDMEIMSMASRRCQKDMYHISINPSQPMTPEDWDAVWEVYEAEFGLSHLPFIEVTHNKAARDGGKPREPHKHRVYERVDVDTGKAVHLNHTKVRNEKVARVVEFTLGHPLTVGKHNRTVIKQLEQDGQQDIIAWMQQGHAHDCDRPIADQEHRDVQMEKRTQLTTAQAKADLQACYESSEDGREFQAAIAEKGYFLVKGSKRDYVIVDWMGGIHSPRRRLGVKAQELKERWADLEREQLSSVDEVIAQLKAHWQRQQSESDASETDAALADNDNQAGAGQGAVAGGRVADEKLPQLREQADALAEEIEALQQQIEHQNDEALNHWQRQTAEPESEPPKPRRSAGDARSSGRGRNTSPRKQLLDERLLVAMQGADAITERQRRLLVLSEPISPVSSKASQSRRLTTDQLTARVEQGATVPQALTDSTGLEEYCRAWHERFAGQVRSTVASRSHYRMADRWIAQRLAQRGYSRQQARRILMQASPEVMEQRAGERLRYIRRVTEKVYIDYERQQLTQKQKIEKLNPVRNAAVRKGKLMPESANRTTHNINEIDEQMASSSPKHSGRKSDASNTQSKERRRNDAEIEL